jgi:hypothetical protein
MVRRSGSAGIVAILILSISPIKLGFKGLYLAETPLFGIKNATHIQTFFFKFLFIYFAFQLSIFLDFSFIIIVTYLNFLLFY